MIQIIQILVNKQNFIANFVQILLKCLTELGIATKDLMTTLRHLLRIKVTEVIKMMERVKIVAPEKVISWTHMLLPHPADCRKKHENVETEIIFVITLLLHCYSLQPNDIKVMVLLNLMFVKITSDAYTFKVYTNDENFNNPESRLDC